jgi:hypothetical protein
MKFEYLFILLVCFAISILSSLSVANAQEQNKTDITYFAIQETKKSEPDTAPGHEQYHQIAIALPEREDGKIYTGQISYSASTPVAVLTLQPIDPYIGQNATTLPLTFADINFTVSFAHSLQGEIAGNQDFAGSSVYFHSQSSAPFIVSYTVVGKVVNKAPVPP